MSGQPQVSILMPLLNQVCFLREALDSILAQSHVDLELIVIDGASTDGSLNILRDYAERDSRIRWSSAPDSGPAEAVNRAASMATGDIIGWLNADDMYEPDAVEHALAYFRENPAAMMAYGHAEIIDAEKRVIGRYPTKPPSTPLTSFADGCFICQPTVFMRREAWQELGGLDASLQASFDFELWVRAFIAWPGRIGFLDRTQAYSRQHDATITHNKRRAVALEALQLLRKHLNITPANWILNHFEEVLVQCPTGEGKAPKDEIRSVLEEAAPLLYESELQKAQRWVNSDRRVALATSDVFVGVHTDGWAGPTLEIRTTSTKGRLNLHCSNLEPCPKKMKLRVTRVDGSQLLRKVSGRGNFLVEIDLVPSRCAAMPAFYTVTCDQHFVPITSPQQPADPRQLCYKINHIEHIT